MSVFVKKETAWIAFVPRLTVIGLLFLLFYQFDTQLYFVYGCITYLVIAYTIGYSLFPRSISTGIKLLRQERYKEAIPFIQKDIDYFTKRSWIDKYRFLLLINSSKKSYREILLCNMASCLLRTGKVKEAKDVYESVLIQYPKNDIAPDELNYINTIAKSVR